MPTNFNFSASHQKALSLPNNLDLQHIHLHTQHVLSTHLCLRNIILFLLEPVASNLSSDRVEASNTKIMSNLSRNHLPAIATHTPEESSKSETTLQTQQASVEQTTVTDDHEVAAINGNVNRNSPRATQWFRAGRGLATIEEADETAGALSSGAAPICLRRPSNIIGANQTRQGRERTAPASPSHSPPSSPTVLRGLRNPAMAERRRGVVFNLINDGRTPSNSNPGLSTDRRLSTIAPAPRPHQHVRRTSAPLLTTNENLHPRGPRPPRMSVARAAQGLDGEMRFGGDGMVPGGLVRRSTADLGTGAETRSGGGRIKKVKPDSEEIRGVELTDS